VGASLTGKTWIEFVCKAHRLLYHSTLGSRVIKKKKTWIAKVMGLEHASTAANDSTTSNTARPYLQEGDSQIPLGHNLRNWQTGQTKELLWQAYLSAATSNTRPPAASTRGAPPAVKSRLLPVTSRLLPVISPKSSPRRGRSTTEKEGAPHAVWPARALPWSDQFDEHAAPRAKCATMLHTLSSATRTSASFSCRV